jgi:hypothetical protein
VSAATAIRFVYDDGGRAAAGFKGDDVRDCVTRALAIATGEAYRAVYEELRELALGDRAYMASLELRYGPQARRHASPRDGVSRKIYDAWLERRGWTWTPTMHIGSGCTMHLRADELPSGRIIVRLSKHLAAVIDGVLHDTHDCSRDGTRCVYGHWTQREEM